MRHVGCLILGVLGMLETGCGSANKSPTEVPGLAHGLAVINSDYHSTALTLLDPNSRRVIDPCLTSGSVTPRLSLALSGDVVLPSQVGPSTELPLLDRSNNAIVWLDPARCAVLRQLAVADGYDADPRDIGRISGNKAYITRYSANPNGPGGNDLLIVDPSAPSITGSIDVSSYAAAPILARPDRMVLTGGLAFVTLGGIDAAYDTYGAGRVLQIDTATDQVVGQIDIADAQSCSGMALSGTWLAVGCDGNFADPNQASHSGVWIYDITDARHPSLAQTLTAASLGQASVSSNSLVLRGNTPTFVATDSTGMQNSLFVGSSMLTQQSGLYVLGGVALLGQDITFISDANANDPAIVQYTGSTAGRIVSAPKSLLPPRSLLLY